MWVYFLCVFFTFLPFRNLISGSVRDIVSKKIDWDCGLWGVSYCILPSALFVLFRFFFSCVLVREKERENRGGGMYLRIHRTAVYI